MSFREKIRLNFPLYFILSLLFSVAVWSLWFPNWFGNADETEAAQLSYSSAVTAKSRVPGDTQVKLLYVPSRSEYAMLFSSSSISTASPTSSCGVSSSGNGYCGIYFTTSTDGITWSPTRTVTTTARFDGGMVLGGFIFDTYNQTYLVSFTEGSANNRKVYLATTQNGGGSWTSTLALNSNVSSRSESALASATSTDMYAVLATNRTNGLYVVTSTITGGVLSSAKTVVPVSFYQDVNTNDPLIVPIGLSISKANGTNVIHAIYATATSTAMGYQISYASSTDLGLTWASTTISTVQSVFSTDVACFECNLNTSALDPDNLLQVLYYQATSYDFSQMGSGIAGVSMRVVYGQLSANGSWTTTTLANTVPLTATTTAGSSNFQMRASSIVAPASGKTVAMYVATSSVAYAKINTSTSFITDDVNGEYINLKSGIGLTYVTSSQTLAVAYTSGYRIRFATSSMRIANYNSPASLTVEPGITQARNASGIITVTTTVADSNRDSATLYVDYSLDGGSTWTSSTIASASGESGSLSTATGRILGITTTDGDQQISFTWDTSVILAASSTSNVKLRFLADDGISVGSYQLTTAFTVDNQAPGLPSELTFASVETTSLSLLWTASTGTPTLYFASSTALTASATSTSATTTAYVNLVPNTQYLFQVKAQDTYSNTSSYSAATSTYTDASAPTAISATNNGASSLIVSWTSDNGSGTKYQLYNVTTGAVVATTTQTTYTVTGLSASTEYQFKVRAQFLQDNDSYSSYSSNSTAVATSAASSGGGGGNSGDSGGAAPAASPPAVPTAPAPVSASQQAEISLAANVPVTRTLGASTHTFTYLSATEKTMNLRIQSEPITVALTVNVPKDVDTNNDQIADVRATYGGLVQGKAKVVIKNLTDENELKNAFTIQAGAYETNSRTVKVMFNGSNIAQVALSNDPNFAGAAFVSYSSPMVWMLSSGNGQKTVYARLRSAQGGMVSVSDTITLANNSAPTIEEPTTPTTPVTPAQPSVPSLSRTLKRNVSGADVKQLQVELQKQGYFPKNIAANSIFGPTTEASVKAFEKAKGLKVDGIVDTATWQVIFGGVISESKSAAPVTVPAKKNLYPGNSGAEVTWVQQKLQSLGFFPKNVTPNGYFGPTTGAAVKSFQKAKGISQTGNVGPMTWEALNK